MTPLRALVIGAGHHGLVCTGSLAEAGWEATVLEQGVRPGGAVHSCERPLSGFVEDPCAGLFPAHASNAVLQAIGLERFGVEWIDASVVMVHPLPEGRDVARFTATSTPQSRVLRPCAPGRGTRGQISSGRCSVTSDWCARSRCRRCRRSLRRWRSPFVCAARRWNSPG